MFLLSQNGGLSSTFIMQSSIPMPSRSLAMLSWILFLVLTSGEDLSLIFSLLAISCRIFFLFFIFNLYLFFGETPPKSGSFPFPTLGSQVACKQFPMVVHGRDTTIQHFEANGILGISDKVKNSVHSKGAGSTQAGFGKSTARSTSMHKRATLGTSFSLL